MGNAVVEGYIVGTTQTTSQLGTGKFEGPFTITTNILIADSPNERDITKVMPVQLPSNDIRIALNLVDNPTNLGEVVKLTGTLSAYFGVPGLKSLTAYEIANGNTAGNEEIRATIASVVDGDTVKLTSPVYGATNVRMLNIDTAETYHKVLNELDRNQLDHGIKAKNHLGTMLSVGQEVILRVGAEKLDGYGRLLAEVITLDGVNTNYQMVLSGHAVTYFIWPFETPQVQVYGNALSYARNNQLGIWNPADPLLEIPFEFRARYNGTTPYRPVGNFLTKTYVDAAEWESIAPEYRVFFNSEADATTAGYSKNLVQTSVAVSTLIFPWVKSVL